MEATSFSELNIKPDLTGALIGKKIPIDDLVNCEIIITRF